MDAPALILPEGDSYEKIFPNHKFGSGWISFIVEHRKVVNS
jgi:hypothetical protein